MSATSIAARLDRIPVSSFHRRMLFLIAGGMFFDGLDTYLAGGVLSELLRSGTSTLQLNALFISSTFAGMTLGALGAGLLGDLYGRKISYQINLGLFGFASLLAAFAPSMTVLIGLRFVMGVGLGAEIVVGYAMLTEFVPPAVRGKWTSSLVLIANSSLFAATLLNALLIPHFGWRPMFAIAGVGALVILAMRKTMPESPRWLAVNGREEEAELIVAGIEASAGMTSASADIRERHVGTVKQSHTDEPRQRPYAASFVVAVVANIAIGLSLYGFITWVPTFLVNQGFGATKSLWYVTFMSLGAPAGAIVSYLLVDRVGRKPAICGAALATIALGWLYCVAKSLPVIGICGFGLFTSIYLLLSLCISTYVPELFETKIRLRAVGFASTCGRIATMVSPFAIVAIFAARGILGVYFLVAASLVALIVAVIALGPETRRKSLEHI